VEVKAAAALGMVRGSATGALVGISSYKLATCVRV
jgi:hypothetical protein